MRVKCINDKWQVAPGCEKAPRPIFLKDYMVIEAKILEGMECYILAELGDAFGYDARFFATLPDEPAEVIEEQQPDYATA